MRLIEVEWTKRKGAGAAARGLGVEAYQEGIEFGVVAGGARDLDDLCELRI